jgi:hypothetical protein
MEGCRRRKGEDVHNFVGERSEVALLKCCIFVYRARTLVLAIEPFETVTDCKKHSLHSARSCLLNRPSVALSRSAAASTHKSIQHFFRQGRAGTSESSQNATGR